MQTGVAAGDRWHLPATCEVDACIRAGNAVIFSPDTLVQAQSEGYRNGYWCLGHAQQ